MSRGWKKGFALAGLFPLLLAATSGLAVAVENDFELTPEQSLGKKLFFEKALSTPPGQACVDCHDPSVAFADPNKELPVSVGAVHGRYGNRNDQPVTYAFFAPPLHHEEEDGEMIWEGGLFWDGRVNTLEEQAQGPPLNPLEMANPDTATVSRALRDLPYAAEITDIYGDDALADAGNAYRMMAKALAAYERSAEFAPFDSKFDLYQQGKAELTDQEQRGFALFVAEDKGNCAACHPHTLDDDNEYPLFTDYTYDNLGVPRNPELPFYSLPPELNPDGYAWVDRGLGAFMNDPAEDGKFRVPSLRNVAITGPYMHNGVFKTLFEVMAFYNSRDVAPWPEPEVAANVNRDELGDLKLTGPEMEDLVVFLGTLTDGWEPTAE